LRRKMHETERYFATKLNPGHELDDDEAKVLLRVLAYGRESPTQEQIATETGFKKQKVNRLLQKLQGKRLLASSTRRRYYLSKLAWSNYATLVEPILRQEEEAGFAKFMQETGIGFEGWAEMNKRRAWMDARASEILEERENADQAMEQDRLRYKRLDQILSGLTQLEGKNEKLWRPLLLKQSDLLSTA
jgi:hypothetical protein